MSDSRTKNTRRNIIISYSYAFISLIFQFVSRSFIVKYLGDLYLGCSSLFSSVLRVLTMAELGFAGAIVYNMYKPLAEGDTETVCALLNYYKKIYRTVGVVVLAAGTAVAPFIPKLITGEVPDDINIYILYFLYLINTSVSYFLFAYKNALLEASQRMDLSKIAYTLVSLGEYALQLFVLVVFKNYYLYMVVLILGTSLRNIVAAIVAKKHFPQYVCRGTVEGELKQSIVTRVKGLLVCKVSSVTYTTFDSIILSSFIGLSSVAIYGNYVTIFSSMTNIVAYIRSAMQASVGNSVATESREKNFKDMLLWQYFFSVIALWCSSCMLNLYQPFMTMWMGEDRLLPFIDVVILCAWFTVSVVQHAYFLYLSGNGLWWELRWPYICSTVFNLVCNIVLGKLLGVTGILLASFLANFIFCFLWQSSIVFKVYFKTSVKKYMLRQFVYFFVTAISWGACWLVCRKISMTGIPGFLVKGIVCTAISGIIVLLASFKTEIFKEAVKFAKRVLKA